jgi:5-methylcytosine-specific restriction enzyme subunit McrC
MRIPIQNLYYLLLYAWDVLEEADLLVVDAEPETRLLGLFGTVLVSGVDHVLRRGLDRGYLPRKEALPGVRGKIDLSASAKGGLLFRARMICEFDELSYNVLHNRIIKATIQRLLVASDAHRELHSRLAGTYRKLHEAEAIPLSRRVFRLVQLHRNNRFYRFLLEVCRLIHRNLLVNEATGKIVFRDFTQDQRGMRRLFERFLVNFYREEQREFKVKRETVQWAARSHGAEAGDLLPAMFTDVSLTSPERKVVIEAKFTPEPLQSYRGKQTLRSAHLYQLFAYLKNLATRGGVNAHVEGILIYPRAAKDLDVSYSLDGHQVRVYTLDLNQPWRQIRDDLLGLLARPARAQAVAEC